MENKLLNFNNEKDTIIDDNTTYNLLEIIPIIIYI